jgi:hypothetical protein
MVERARVAETGITIERLRRMAFFAEGGYLAPSSHSGRILPRSKPHPGPRAGSNPLDVSSQSTPLCSRYCGPTA